MPVAYKDDFYAWTQETAKALAEGRTEGVDLQQVAEEIEDMGKGERHALESHLARILVHMLKFQYQPMKRTRSWDLSIEQSRVKLRRLLRESPSLKSALPELFNDAYEDARLEASRQTGLALETFPHESPFPLDDVLAGDRR